MTKEKKLLGFYDYTVILTYCGMLFAFAGILLSLKTSYTMAVICLMLAGLCDMFDGAVASTKKGRTEIEKHFGIQIDSLSDLISFGIFPAVFMYCLMDKAFYAACIAAFYSLCALIRLAYFNVTEEERQNQTSERRTTYLGVPVTSISFMLPAVYILFAGRVIPYGNIVPLLLIVQALGFIVPFNVKKPHGSAKIVFIVIGLAELVCLILLARA